MRSPAWRGRPLLNTNLHPRTRAAVRLDDRAEVSAVSMGDVDLQFRGVPPTLLASIVAHFTGRETLGSICRRYPEPVAGVIQLVATEMRARNMLLLSPEGREAWPEEDALPRGAATWRYILDRIPDPAAAWRRWRCNPVIVSGQGLSFATAVAGMLDAGIGQIWIDPSGIKDQARIAAQLAEHSDRDADFVWRYLDPDEVIGSTVMVHVVDGSLAAEGDKHFRPHASGRIIAGKVGSGGLVVSRASGDASTFVPDDAGKVFMSRYALEVLGNMAAFQALNLILAGDDAAAGALLPFGSAMRVHPDGQFEAVGPTRAASTNDGKQAAQATPASTASPQQRERERWSKFAAPFMAEPSPLLAWDNDTPLSVFPLPHRAMTIKPADGDRPVRIVTWAVSPIDVTSHAIRRGIEQLADFLQGARGHAAAADEEEWCSRAYIAWAQSKASVRLTHPPERQLRYDDVVDVEFRTLVRLAGLYLGETPRVYISTDLRSGLARADVVAGKFERFALGASPLKAAVTALGAMLSAHQLGDSSVSNNSPPAEDVTACHLAVTETVSIHPERLGLVPRMLDALNNVRLGNLLIGRFSLGPDDA